MFHVSNNGIPDFYAFSIQVYVVCRLIARNIIQ